MTTKNDEQVDPVVETGNANEGGDPQVGATEDWRDKEIERLRRENAQRRTQNAELKEALEGAKSAEEFQAAQADWESKVKTLEEDLDKERRTSLLERTKTATGLDDAKVQRLVGETYEELVADAKALFGEPRVEGEFKAAPKGGLRPGVEPESEDPKEAANAVLKAKYSR